MKIVQITPGAGGMYCGNCFRDNALVSALRKLGHEAILLSLYLPMTLDEENETRGTPLFFSGINVYLQQKIPIYQRAPNWLRNLVSSPLLLKVASNFAGKTKANEVGDLTISMLKGEQGNQVRELDELIGWLKQPANKPDIICLSNGLLVGLARRLQNELGIPVACMVQGEDSFLDSIGEKFSAEAWSILSQRIAELDLVIAPSHYYGGRMEKRLNLAAGKMQVVYNGIQLSGYPSQPVDPPGGIIGYFARMCPEKGLDFLIAAFIELKKDPACKNVKLRVGGSCGPGDEPFVAKLKQQLAENNLASDVQFFPNLSREDKIRFFKGITILSVPAPYGEAFGLYMIESLASGIPVVQPDTAAFPELVRETKGGLLYPHQNLPAYVKTLKKLLGEPELRAQLAVHGFLSVHQNFSSQAMAERMARLFSKAIQQDSSNSRRAPNDAANPPANDLHPMRGSR